jgi:predicted DCC family thiol-disulfide oxidoreductase YuxK
VDDLIVLYDGDCGFCSVMMAILLSWDRANRIGPVSIQSARGAELLSDLTGQDRLTSWHLIDASATRYSGGEAIPVVLDPLPGGALIARAAARFPSVTSRVYEWIADHRVLLGRGFKARPRAWAARVIADRERLANARPLESPEGQSR